MARARWHTHVCLLALCFPAVVLISPCALAETFGKVTDCVIMCDPHTRKPRGFGFITYDNTASVDRVCANKFHDLNGTAH